MVFFCANYSAIDLAKNNHISELSKNIDIYYYCIQKLVYNNISGKKYFVSNTLGGIG
jgi:hypothetical protein